MPAKSAIAVSRATEKAVRQQLDRILASRTFHPVARIKRFLNFIVLEGLAGRSDQLKEYVIALQVFEKEPSFDPRTDPLVRVQARRLRARLVRYYRDEGHQDDVVIELPKGGYAPVFKTPDRSVLQKRSMSATLVAQNTVSVAPFSDDSASGDLDYICKGVRDEIIHRLARVESLRVLAWDSTDANNGRGPLQGRDLVHAAMIIMGSIRTSGDRLRVTIQLVDGASGCYLWSESIDGTLADTFATQEQIAQAVTARVQPELCEREKARWARRPTENLAANNLYLQGRYHLNQRTEEGLQRAADFFEKAVAEDPQYALAHSGLADAYSLLAHYGVLGPAAVWTKAAASAAAAVMLDGDSAEARTSLAHVRATQDWDWLGAHREFQRAIALDGRYPTAHHWYGTSCLVPMGRLDEALEEMQIAQALDPVSSIIARDLAVMQYYRRDFEAALEQCDHTIELNPHFSPAYWLLGLIQEQRGDLDESIAAFQRAVHLSPQSPRMQGALGRALALSGKRQSAMKILRTLADLAKHRYVSPFERAAIHFALGDEDRGFRWLTKAVDDRVFDVLAIKVDPRVDALKSDDRFVALTKRVGVD